MDTGEQETRGGFQNRDVGGTLYNFDLGPEYGVDFALFARPNSLIRDLALKKELLSFLTAFVDIELYVKNGFVFLKGAVGSEGERKTAEQLVSKHPEVLRVVNVLQVRYLGGEEDHGKITTTDV